ncbi:phenylalanine--tRNA ligase subunit beta [Candidatus Woesearchaeota archaeon]|nr:phenylalanine--tRNA ligase subunit beta [Candidatus Woesearchaeota archaeon]
MPTITFAFKDFQQLLGKKLTMAELEDLLVLYAKAEVENYDKKSGEISVKLDDTNLPYVWCPEGLARFLKGVSGMRKGAARLKVNGSSYKIIVDDSVKKARPFITAFVAKGRKLDDYLLKQLVQMQEKFCEGYGRRRQKVSIGLYSYKRIAFPVHYKAVVPESVRFAPLEFDRKLNLREILQQHPKGRQYGWIIQNFPKYPLLLDDKGEVLSLPPIINSNFTGRLEVGDSELLFEATGTDEESTNLAANIFAQNMSERGFQIHAVAVKYSTRTVTAPEVKTEKARVSPQEVEQLTGLKLKDAEINQLLQRAGYDVEGGYAVVPRYRADIMHPADVIEDVAIAYGFGKIREEPLRSYTIGAKDKSAALINSLRKVVAGAGFQEIFSHILTDKKSLAAAAADAGKEKCVVELENPMSETYSAVRSSLLPGLLDVLSRNKHADYPQKVFEEGIVAARDGSKVREWHSLALVSAHSKADFTEQKQHLSAIFASLGTQFAIRPAEHAAFIRGRAGSIIVDKKILGIIGEISPAVLSRFGIEMPAAALELDLSLLS